MAKKQTTRSDSHDTSATKDIDARIKGLRDRDDWRGDTLARIRTIIKQADPDVVEEIKWRKPTNPAGVPVWSHPTERSTGIICTGELYKDKVKLTFAHGAAVADPATPSTPGSKARPAAQSTCTKVTHSTKMRSKRWCARR